NHGFPPRESCQEGSFTAAHGRPERYAEQGLARRPDSTGVRRRPPMSAPAATPLLSDRGRPRRHGSGSVPEPGSVHARDGREGRDHPRTRLARIREVLNDCGVAEVLGRHNLDEFVFRFDRRWQETELFIRVLNRATQAAPCSYRQLTAERIG
ncbi:MAG: hypothetical protein V3T35_04515, partial [Spirochaetia bacterium]